MASGMLEWTGLSGVRLTTLDSHREAYNSRIMTSYSSELHAHATRSGLDHILPHDSVTKMHDHHISRVLVAL